MKQLFLASSILLIMAVVSCNRQSVESESEDNSKNTTHHTDIQLVSERWKKERRISDFHILRAELPPGVTSRRVVDLLGEPIGDTQDEGKEYYEYIQGFIDNTTGWGAVISREGKLIEWYQDPPQSIK